MAGVLAFGVGVLVGLFFQVVIVVKQEEEE